MSDDISQSNFTAGSTSNMSPISNGDGVKSHRKISKFSLIMIAICFVGISPGFTVTFYSHRLIRLERMLIEINHKDKADISWYPSVLFLGIFFTAPFAGFLCDRIGRKLTAILGVLPALLSWILSTIAVTHIHDNELLTLLLLSQFVAGISVAFGLVSVTIYTAEICPQSLRGRCFCFSYASFMIGVFVAYASDIKLESAWLGFIGLFLHSVASGCMALLPESPRYLFMKNKRTEALLSLEWLHDSDDDVEGEYSELEAVLSYQDTMECSHYSKSTVWKPMILSITANFLKPLCGIEVFYIYNHYIIYECLELNWKTNYSPSYALISIVVQIVTCLLVAYLSTKFGRRSLISMSAILTFVCCMFIGIYCFFEQGKNMIANNGYTIYMVAATLYNMAFTLALGPLLPLVTVEMLPLRVRAHGIGMAYAAESLMTFVLSKLFVKALNTIHTHGLFWTFSAGGVLLAAFAIAFLPDIKNQSLEEIELYFENGSFTRPFSVSYNSVETRLTDSSESIISRYTE